MDPTKLDESVELKDGGEVLLRPIRPEDKKRLLEFFESLSGRTIRSRFLRLKATLSEEELAHYTELDFVDHVGIVVTIESDGRESIIGVGRYLRLEEEGGKRAEIAIAVTDDHHRRGIGDLLLKRLSEIASSQGIEEFEMLVPEENKRRIEAVESTGRVVSTTTDFGIARLVIRTG